MTGIRYNIAANLFGRLWAALMSFAFVPLYIRYLGIEAYGLIGFFASMMAVFALLDLGLGLTVNRELARATTTDNGRIGARDLLRTLESVYWGIALLIGVAIILAAPLIVDDWLNIGTIDREAAITGVRAMGVTALMRWPVTLYFGALTGLQRQVPLNIVTSIAATLMGAGAVAILALTTRTIATFFLWQALIAGVQVAVLRRLTWRSLAVPGHRARIKLTTMRATLGFSAAVTGITLLSIILTQLDKFMLSRMLPLDVFGRYALSGAIAGVLTTIGTAVEGAAFPALSKLVAAGDGEGERHLYHQASQGLALLILPPAVALMLFARELLGAYIGDPAIVASTHQLLSMLAAGSGLLALMFMPLALQLAHGWTSLSLIKNIVAVAIFAPLLYLLVEHFGAQGAAGAWLCLTAGYFLIEVPIMHRRLLPNDQWRWYRTDIGVPLVTSLGLLGGLRLVMPDWPIIVQVAIILLTALIALIVSALMLPMPRDIILAWSRGFRRRSPLAGS